MTRKHPAADVCARKVRFGSLTAAKRARRAGKDRTHPYICPVCHGWHMGGGDHGKRSEMSTHEARERRKRIAATRAKEAAEIK